MSVEATSLHSLQLAHRVTKVIGCLSAAANWTVVAGPLTGTVSIDNGVLTDANLSVNLAFPASNVLTKFLFPVPPYIAAYFDLAYSTQDTWSLVAWNCIYGPCTADLAGEVLSFTDANGLISDAVYTHREDNPSIPNVTYNGATGTITVTPIPTALPLFASGLAGLGLLGWRRKKKTAAG